MKKRNNRAVEILILLGGCLVLPPTTWASHYYGPSGAVAGAQIFNWEYNSILANCSSGFLPSAAACDTGTVLGYSYSGDAYSGSAAGIAKLANGVLDLNVSGGNAISSGANVGIKDSLYFQGATAGQMGQLTMTATGALSGDNAEVQESLYVSFMYDYSTPYGYAGPGPWDNSATASTRYPLSWCYAPSALPTQACYSSDGQNLMVSVTFPLNSDGIYFVAAMNGYVTGEGGVGYTDPFIVTLPPGVTFTSASGLFLAPAADTAVPEPSSALLVGIVIAAILGFRKARKRVAPSDRIARMC